MGCLLSLLSLGVIFGYLNITFSFLLIANGCFPIMTEEASLHMGLAGVILLVFWVIALFMLKWVMRYLEGIEARQALMDKYYKDGTTNN
jgi:hypothetical protein